MVRGRPSVREVPSSFSRVTTDPSFDFFPFRVEWSSNGERRERGGGEEGRGGGGERGVNERTVDLRFVSQMIISS